jgi:aldose 1-epimerase
MNPEIITLSDSATGASAAILVSHGFNCYRFAAQLGGRPVEVLYAPDDFTTGSPRPSKGGITLMLPFPCRIPGTTFTWEGHEYELEAGDGRGNAIHGFVMWRPWRVIEHTATKAVGQFHAWRDDPELKKRWPADFRITATYELAGHALLAQYQIENPGDVPLPCGFGTHPYFRVPLGGRAADDCVVSLPVSEQWELNNLLPTGKRQPLENARQYQAGQRYAALELDNVFTGLIGAGEGYIASIHDPGSGVRVSQHFDENFRECVAYTPPHREAICIEPLTCAPSCFELTRRGIDAGLKIVPPGGQFTVRVEIRVSAT